jgi:hypothetical protein
LIDNMNLPEHAILCATLDISDGDDANFVEWHTREHLVERLAISGFLRGRRFVQEAASPRYLILYDVESLAVLSQPDYVERLNHPTPWTRATLATFQNGRRSAYRLIAQQGGAEGAFLMVIRVAPDEPDRVQREIERAVRGEWSARPGIATVAFAIPDRLASTLDTEESRRSGNCFAEEWVVLVEGISEQSLLDFARNELTSELCERWAMVKGDGREIYRLQVRIGRSVKD